jgi:hypothetical protein
VSVDCALMIEVPGGSRTLPSLSFAVLPRVGELIALPSDGPKPYVLTTVVSVTHFAEEFTDFDHPIAILVRYEE